MNDQETLTILPGVYDGLGASIARHLGAEAVYASGGRHCAESWVTRPWVGLDD